MKNILIFTTALLLFFTGCSSGKRKKDYILSEKNLIPEGTAFDNTTGIIYIGSTFKRKIIQINPDGEVADFIPGQDASIWSVVGMEVDEDRNILWVNTAHANEVMPLIHPDPARDWMTAVVAYDLKNKRQLKKYTLNAEKAFLNDLTVAPNGDVYITESVNHKLYKIDSKTDSLQLFINIAGFDFLNGITCSDKHNFLYVSTVQGILKIDIGTKSYQLIKTCCSINAKGIDGLTFYKNQLIGHQSSKVSRFYLNENGDELIKSEVLDTGPEFDASTTGEVGGNYYYYIVNSQIRSSIDKKNKTIKPPDSLNNTIIRKINL